MTPGGGNQRDHAAELARELRAARVEAGLSLKELEPLTASSDSSLSRYLSGASIPPWSVVEALCTAARRDPKDLVPLWEAAQRSKVARRVRARESDGEAGRTASQPADRGPGPEDGADGPGGESGLDVAADTNAASPDGAPPRAADAGSETPAEPRSGLRRARLASRAPVLAGVGIGALAAAVAVGVAFAPGHAPPAPRVCPWHYVVTDGNPAPVKIADSWQADRALIGFYEPSQVFYVPEPPTVRGGLMKTVDGWVTAGDWIQRYDGPCVSLARTGPDGRP